MITGYRDDMDINFWSGSQHEAAHRHCSQQLGPQAIPSPQLSSGGGPEPEAVWSSHSHQEGQSHDEAEPKH